ncbi:hypothetical protein [Stieleria neptunia]|uniref:hypothetical protein n=1 Tax=Stieleria neptunia TaxID=2527979 RepID=UPI0018D2476A|nr:hypothetical protein [Stieleria neptunia]
MELNAADREIWRDAARSSADCLREWCVTRWELQSLADRFSHTFEPLGEDDRRVREQEADCGNRNKGESAG